MASEFVRKIDETRIEDEPKETSESGDLLITRPIKDDDYGDLSKFDKDTQGGVYGHIGNQYRRLDNGVDLEKEEARAKQEEARLDKKIDDETDRAKQEEARLDKKIDDETKRAKGAESALDNKIEAIKMPTVEYIPQEKLDITYDDTMTAGNLNILERYRVNYGNISYYKILFSVVTNVDIKLADNKTYPLGNLIGDYSKVLLGRLNNIYAPDGKSKLDVDSSNGLISLTPLADITSGSEIDYDFTSFIKNINIG